MTAAYSDARQYLSRVEQALVGWSVVREFSTNTPRFVRWLEQSGPHATARLACARAFTLYVWGFGLPGVIFSVAGLAAVADVLYVLAGASALWAATCIVSARKPRRDFRAARSRDRADQSAPSVAIGTDARRSGSR